MWDFVLYKLNKKVNGEEIHPFTEEGKHINFWSNVNETESGTLARWIMNAKPGIAIP